MDPGDAGRRSGLDKFPEPFGLRESFIESVLHQISDADDAHKPSILDDGQVADAAFGHHAEAVDHRVIRCAGSGLRRHQLADLALGEAIFVFSHRVSDVSLGDDSDDCAVLNYRQCTDFPFGEFLRSLADGLFGVDRSHATSFFLQNIPDIHLLFSLLGRPACDGLATLKRNDMEGKSRIERNFDLIPFGICRLGRQRFCCSFKVKERLHGVEA